jgi:prepilin-type N-terminal cleavage/methylation domain-containing protein/prepilin-type processing-associated H-X9-DG protein
MRHRSKTKLADLPRRHRRAFTLVELLVAVAIIAVLAALIAGGLPKIRERGRQAASINNLRQIGAGFFLYAGDNDYRLPGHIETSDKWPRLIHHYLNEVKIYAEPGNPANFINRRADPLSNASNNTNYIMNGYNDLGAHEDETIVVRLNSIGNPSAVALLGILTADSPQPCFYMDAVFGDSSGTLNRTAYGRGSNYLFMDGSARFISDDDYSDDIWLVDKDPDPNPE